MGVILASVYTIIPCREAGTGAGIDGATFGEVLVALDAAVPRPGVAIPRAAKQAAVPTFRQASLYLYGWTLCKELHM